MVVKDTQSTSIAMDHSGVIDQSDDLYDNFAAFSTVDLLFDYIETELYGYAVEVAYDPVAGSPLRIASYGPSYASDGGLGIDISDFEVLS
jgi:hypothetical protein